MVSPVVFAKAISFDALGYFTQSHEKHVPHITVVEANGAKRMCERTLTYVKVLHRPTYTPVIFYTFRSRFVWATGLSIALGFLRALRVVRWLIIINLR